MNGERISRQFRKLKAFLPGDLWILTGLAAVMLLLHLVTAGTYEFHRDEFLYIAMGHHPAWGYLEVPPFIAGAAAFTRLVLGGSLLAYRFLPALAGALLVFVTGLMAKEMGGNRFGQGLAGLSILLTPAFLRSSTLFQPVVFEQLFWGLAAYVAVKILKQSRPKYWIMLGVICGLGLLTKYTMLLFGFGLFLGLLISARRNLLASPWPWLAAGLCFLIALPNILWQHEMDWPLIEHLQVLGRTQLTNVRPSQFLLMQIIMLFLNFPLILFGIYYTLFHRAGKPFRTLGWMFLIILLTLLLLSGKAYYLMPAYPMLLAAGAVLLERLLPGRLGRFMKPVVVGVMVLGTLPSVPYGVPLLPLPTLQSYAGFMAKMPGMEEPLRWEDGRLHSLPQDFADMIGWRNLASNVGRVVRMLPQEERRQAMIFAANYGEAGCLDYYRETYALPPVISFSGSYYTWGPPDQEPSVLIMVGFQEQDLTDYFHSVQPAAAITHPYARENRISVYLCRRPVKPLIPAWPEFKQERY